MKKNFFVFSLLVFIGMLTFTSCNNDDTSSDDVKNEVEKMITGKWAWDWGDGDYGFYCFQKDGNGYYVEGDDTGTNHKALEWSYDPKTRVLAIDDIYSKIEYPEEEDEDFIMLLYIEEVTSSYMKVHFMDEGESVSMTWTRIN